MTEPPDRAEPPDLVETRAAYDTVAAEYSELRLTEVAAEPIDRALLVAFADLVRAGEPRPVADVGCGPGQLTAHLASLGLDVFGVDLSPRMVAMARRAHPELRFDEGSMLDLDIADGALAGVLAWYSLIHTPPERRPVVVAEFHRVLAAGGRLLLAFQAGDERVHITRAYGHDVSVQAYRLAPERVAALLEDAGFVVDARLVREPGEKEKTAQAFVLAHKPS